MPTRTVLIIGSIVIVALIAIIPLAFFLGGRHATSHQPVAKAAPASSATSPSQAAPVSAASPSPQVTTHDDEDAPQAKSDPDGADAKSGAHTHAKGGLLGGLVASVGDDVAAEGKKVSDDVEAKGKAVVDKAHSDANAALTKTVDHAASSVDSAANELEQKAQQSVNNALRTAPHDPHDGTPGASDDPSFKAFLDSLTKQEAADAAALTGLSSTVRTDIAAAAKDVSAKVHAYGDSIKKMASPTNLLHSLSVPDEATIARDVDKQAAQVRSALEAFTASTEAIQHRCDDAVAHMHQNLEDERAKLSAQMNQAEAACEKQIASLRSDATADIAQAVAAATRPLDDAQNKSKTTRSGK